MDVNRFKRYANQVKKDAEGLDRRLIARVSGVTFEGRQAFLARVGKSTEVKLERDRRNEHDFYAVKVLALLDSEWIHVGFVPRPMCKMVSRSIDSGVALACSVHRRSGGMEDDYGDQLNYGLEINIIPERQEV